MANGLLAILRTVERWRPQEEERSHTIRRRKTAVFCLGNGSSVAKRDLSNSLLDNLRDLRSRGAEGHLCNSLLPESAGPPLAVLIYELETTRN